MIIMEESTTQTSQRRDRQRIFLLAAISRVVLLLAMAISCAIIPDFNPGDDVLQFNLRLDNRNDAAGSVCFCLQGHACDVSAIERQQRLNMANEFFCADDDNDTKQHRYYWLDQFYSFILPPITKWDAARFLTLSVDPWARYPPLRFIEQYNCNDGEDDTQTCNVTTADRYKKAFNKSEQAHAFLPLFPLIVRFTAGFLIKSIPNSFLPSTYEASIAFTAVIVNMLAFAIAAVSLYDLTIFMSMRNDIATIKDDNTRNNKMNSYSDISKTTAELFCVNPAGVFFTSAYSESVFAMLTFAGHAVAARGLYDTSLKRRNAKSNRPSIFWLLSTLLWALASYVRSNGTFSSVWLMLIGIGQCCSYISTAISAKQDKFGCITAVMKCASILFCHGILAMIVAAPVFYHDARGHRFHCIESNISVFNNNEWCTQAEDSAKFSLYTHVQRKHWNVGLLRYYELKQIPNFILAMPILLLSFGAAIWWIVTSWNSLIAHLRPSNKRCVTLKNVFWWAFQALSLSSDSGNSISTVSNSSQLLLGPSCLPYYAVLAGFALLGTFVAHVQISTRLICSSCPALYWCLTMLITNAQENDKGSKTSVRPIHAMQLIRYYIILFNILGVIMHVNWLPWT